MFEAPQLITTRELALDEAMSRYADGDAEAFAILYAGLEPRLRYFLRGFACSSALVDDFVQETFARMHRSRTSFVSGRRVVPWAYQIARNAWLDHVRSPRERAHRVRDGTALAPAEPSTGPEADSEQAAIARETAVIIERALSELPSAQREAFAFLRYDGMSVRETAKILGSTPAAVKLRAFRAYETLRYTLHQQRATQTTQPQGPTSWLAVADSLALHGDYDAAERAYRAALLQRRASGCLAPGEETDVLLRLARVLLHSGRYAEARQVCERARRFAPVRELQAISLAMLALTHCYTGWLDRVDDSIAEARDLLRRRNGENLRRRLRAEALIWRAAGNLACARTTFGAAAAAYRRAARISRSLHDRWEHSIALYNLADAALGQGKTADAFRLLDRAGSEKQAIGDTWGLAYVHHARARAHLVRVQARPALDEASTGLQLALRVADPKLVALLNVTLGRAHQANGDLVGAQRSLELAVDAARNASPIELTEARRALAELESATHRN